MTLTINTFLKPWIFHTLHGTCNHIFYVDDDSAFVHFVSFQMLKKAFYNTDIMKFLGGVKLIDSNYCNIYMGVGLYPPPNGKSWPRTILTLKFISKTKLFYLYTKIHHSLLNSAHLIVFKNLSWTLHHLMCLSCVTWAFKARFNNFHFCIILHVIPLPSIYAIQSYRPSHIMRLN